MASDSDRPLAPMLLIAATMASAVLWWFGSGLQPVWWLTWLAPLPVLLSSTRVSAGRAVLSAVLAYAIGGCNQWSYLHDMIGLPLAVILLAIAVPGFVLALCALLFRGLLRRGHAVAASVAVPSLWIAIEYLGESTSPHGTFGNIGYTQMDALPVIQIAAVTGIWGIGFLLLLLPSASAAVLSAQSSVRGKWFAGGLTALIVCGSIGFGALRLQEPPLTTSRIGLVSLAKPIRPSLRDAAGQQIEARYVAAIDRLAQRGARTVVIPETSVATADASIPGFAQVAQRDNVVVDAGVEFQGDPGVERNMAMVFLPTATTPATYNKHHLIPGFENRYKPGDDYTLLAGAARIGLAVCKDMDFHDIGQAYADRQAQLLLVPAWDFNADGWLHSRMAILRGIESGFAIARSARSGRLTLSDDRGRVVAETSSEGRDGELIGELPLRATRTFYARCGDWFAWFALALACFCILLVAFGKGRASAP